MVKRLRVGDWCCAFVVTCEVLRNGNPLPDFQVPIPAEGLKRSHIFPATDVKRVVDGNERAAVFYQWAHFVDEARAVN